MDNKKREYSFCCRIAIRLETKELKQTVGILMDACRELMAECGKKRAANWEIIDNAMAAGGKVEVEAKV